MKARICCPKCHGQDVLLLKSVALGYPVKFAKVERTPENKHKIEIDYDNEKMSLVYEINSNLGLYCRECQEIFDEPELLYLPSDSTPLEKLVFDWQGYIFQSSTVKTPEFKKFANELQRAIKKELPDYIELVKFSVGHFFISGFFKNESTGKFAYFNFSDVRYFKDGWIKDVLVKRCRDTEDYTGGKNNSVELLSLIDMVVEITGGNQNG